MGLRTKAILAVNAVVIFAGVLMCAVGYYAGNGGSNFAFIAVAAMAVAIFVCGVVSNFVIGKAISMLNEVVDAMQKISAGDLRI